MMEKKAVYERSHAQTGTAFLVLIRDRTLAEAIGTALRSRLSDGGKPAVVLTPPMSGADLLDPGACRRLRVWWDEQETGIELSDAVVVALDDDELSGLGRGAFLGVLPEQDGVGGVRPHGNTVVDVPVGTVEELADAVAAYALASHSPVFQVGAAVGNDPVYQPIPLQPIAGRAKTTRRRLGFSPALLVTGTLVAGGWMLSAALGSSNAEAATMPTHTHSASSHQQDMRKSLRQVGFAVNKLAQHEAATHVTPKHTVVHKPVKKVTTHASPTLRHVPHIHSAPHKSASISHSQFRVLPAESAPKTQFPWSNELRAHLQPKVAAPQTRATLSAQLRKQIAKPTESAIPQTTLRNMSDALSAVSAAPSAISDQESYASADAPSTELASSGAAAPSAGDQAVQYMANPAKSSADVLSSSLSTPTLADPAAATSDDSAADQDIVLASATMPSASAGFQDSDSGCSMGSPASCFSPVGGSSDPTDPHIPTGPEYVSSLIPQGVKDAAGNIMNFINDPDPANYVSDGKVTGFTVGAGPLGVQITRGKDANGVPSTYIAPTVGANLPSFQLNYGAAPQPGMSVSATGSVANGPLSFTGGAGFSDPNNQGNYIYSTKAGGTLFGVGQTNSQNYGSSVVTPADTLGVPTLLGTPKASAGVTDTVKISQNGIEGIPDLTDPFPNFPQSTMKTFGVPQSTIDSIYPPAPPPGTPLPAMNPVDGSLPSWFPDSVRQFDPYDPSAVPDGNGGEKDVGLGFDPNNPYAFPDGNGGEQDSRFYDAYGNPLPFGAPVSIPGDQTAAANGYGGGIDLPSPQDLADINAQQANQDLGDLNTLSQVPGGISGLAGTLGLGSTDNDTGQSMSPLASPGPFSPNDPMGSAFNGLPQSGGLFPNGLGDLSGVSNDGPAANQTPADSQGGTWDVAPGPIWQTVVNGIGPVINGYKEGSGSNLGPIGGVAEAGWNGLTTVFPNLPSDISAPARQGFTDLIGQDNQNAIDQQLDPNDPNSFVSKAENLFPDAPYNGEGLIPGFIDSLSGDSAADAPVGIPGGPITDANGDEIVQGQLDPADLSPQQADQDLGDLNTLSQDPGAISGLAGMLGLSGSDDGGQSMAPFASPDPFSAEDPMGDAFDGMSRSGGLFPDGMGDFTGNPDLSSPISDVDGGTAFGDDGDTSSDATDEVDGGVDGIPGLADSSWDSDSGDSSDYSDDSDVDSGTAFGDDGDTSSDATDEVDGGVDGIPGLADSSWDSDGSDDSGSDESSDSSDPYANSDDSMDMAPDDLGLDDSDSSDSSDYSDSDSGDSADSSDEGDYSDGSGAGDYTDDSSGDTDYSGDYTDDSSGDTDDSGDYADVGSDDSSDSGDYADVSDDSSDSGDSGDYTDDSGDSGSDSGGDVMEA